MNRGPIRSRCSLHVWFLLALLPGGGLKGQEVVSLGARSPHTLRVAGSRLYFTAYDAAHGEELWISDGTPEGTRLVKDVNPGPENGLADRYDYDYPWLEPLAGKIVFMGNDADHGAEPWVSDGTAEGTFLLKDILPGPGTSIPFRRLGHSSLRAFGGRVFFNADDGANGRELWVTDGTVEGTGLFKDIVPGPAGSFPAALTAAGANLFFIAEDGTHGRELWRSDGTAEGTILLRDLVPGENGPSFGRLHAIGGTLFFGLSGGRNPGLDDSEELWASDGTPGGTHLVKALRRGEEGSRISDLVDMDGKLYFVVTDGETGEELWTSDGTPDGTRLVKDIFPGPFGSNPFFLEPWRGRIYFSASAPEEAESGLWASDGTPEGTVFVTGLYPQELRGTDAGLFFTADVPSSGLELWVTDGTDEETRIVQDLAPGPEGSSPSSLTHFDGTLFVSADDGVHGEQLWRVGASGLRFRRGDANSDGTVNLADAVNTLDFLFLNGAALDCPDAADADATGLLNITDAVFLLNHLFLGGPAPPAPGASECGTDPGEDSLETCRYAGGLCG